MRGFLKFFEARIPRKYWRKFFRKHIWIGILGAALLFGTIKGTLWAHQKWTERQSRNLVDKAKAAWEKGRLEEGMMGLETAMRLDDSNNDAIRLKAKFLKSLGREIDSLAAWQKLADRGGLQNRDVPEYATIAIEQKEWNIAERLVDALAAGGPSAYSHILKAEIHAAKGDFEAAKKSFKSAVDYDNGISSRAALAGFLLKNQKDADQDETFKLLKGLSEESGPVGSWALALGISRGFVPRESLREWTEKLQSHPFATTQMWLRCEDVKIKTNLETKPLSAIRVYARFSNSNSIDRTTALRWLLSTGEAGLGSRLFSLDEALENKNAFPFWIESLANSGRRTLALNALEDPRNPLREIDTNIIKAIILRQMRRVAESQEIFRDALKKTNNEQDRLKLLALVFMASEQQVFEQGIKPMLKDPKQAQQVFKHLLPVVRNSKNISHTRRFHEIALESGGLPGQTHLKSEISYSDLILGRNFDANDLRGLAIKNPDDMVIKMPWILYLLKHGETAKAKAEIAESRKIFQEDELMKARFEMLCRLANEPSDREFKFHLLSEQEVALMQRALIASSFVENNADENNDEQEKAAQMLRSAHFHIQSGLNGKNILEISNTLIALSQRRDKIGAEALELGLSSGVVPVAQMENWIQAAMQHPDGGFSLKRLAAEACITREPKLKAETVRQAVAKLSNQKLEERAVGAAWALSLGESQTAGLILARNEAVTEPQLFSLWLEIQAQNRDWESILAEVSQDNANLPDYFRLLLKGRAFCALGKNKEGLDAYNSAIYASKNNEKEYLETIAYIASYGDIEAITPALHEKLRAQGADAKETLKKMAQIVATSRDGIRLWKLYKRAAAMPHLGNDPEIENLLDYWSIMTGLPTDGERIAKRSQENPGNFHMRLTNAIFLMENGKGPAALQELENCEPDVDVLKLDPNKRAITAVALVNGGRFAEGLQLALSVPPSELSRQEAAFMARHINACLINN
jgi:hypothetical protein